MKPATLLLTGILALGAAMSGTALAHGDGGRDRGHWDQSRHVVHRHHEKHRHHDKHRYWRRDHRAYRPHYRVPAPHGDSWYGVHLFFGGH